MKGIEAADALFAIFGMKRVTDGTEKSKTEAEWLGMGRGEQVCEEHHLCVPEARQGEVAEDADVTQVAS